MVLPPVTVLAQGTPPLEQDDLGPRGDNIWLVASGLKPPLGMSQSSLESRALSRRALLKTAGWAPSLFIAAPFHRFALISPLASASRHAPYALRDSFNLTRHY